MTFFGDDEINEVKREEKAKEEETFAYEYAIDQASLNAYLSIDGKKVYCSLTNFYYNSDTNKLLEIGNTYSKSRIAWMYNKYEKLSHFCPKEYEDIASYYIVSDLVDIGLNNSHAYGLVDFSEILNKSIKDKNYSKSAASKISVLLINADLAKGECAAKAVEYYIMSGKTPGNAKYVIETAVPFINQNIIAIQDNLVDFANTFESKENTQSSMGIH